ncbi:MAG: acyl-CoA dehydrogenase family protein [Armatimonadetes bacterium]|nr:acyl-CoA dehydrogenase family protein [Armatimonadota bacterium]
MSETTQERGCSFASIEPATIATPESFSADERLMVDTADQFSRKEVLPLAARLDTQEPGLMPALVRKAGELGFCGVDAPEAYGGLGLGKNIAAAILQRLSLDAGFSVTVGITSGIAQFGPAVFGTPEQKERYLPRLTSGEWIGAYALSEPESGSDALSLSTRAEKRGDKWVLNGTKMWISNAQWADFFLTMAKVDGEHVTAFLVERAHPGVSVGREEHKLGLKGSSTARLVLDNAEIPAENVLHEVGKGHQVAFNALNLGRYKLGAMSLGPTREAIFQAAGYAQERNQFGQAIGEFGLVRKKFADMAAWFFAAESCLARTGALIDQAFAASDGSIEGGKAASEEFSVECSICKVLATEAEDRIVDEALQVYGGYGFTEEFPVARIYRDARVSRIYEGTNEINRVFISSRFLRRVKEGRAEMPVGDGFVFEALAKAMAVEPVHQTIVGAQSDLLMLAFAVQSARLRAKQAGGATQMAADRFTNWANVQAAEALQVVTGQAVSIPAPLQNHTDELATFVMAGRAPV